MNQKAAENHVFAEIRLGHDCDPADPKQIMLFHDKNKKLQKSIFALLQQQLGPQTAGQYIY